MQSSDIWVTWEDHRRSRELCAALGAKYVVLRTSVRGASRYILLSVKTVLLMVRNRSCQRVYCQNPSIVLAALLGCLKFLGYALIVDRHSNFKLQTTDSKNIKWKVFHWLSRFSIRRANLTIVTNSYLADLVESLGGRAFVLPDKLPDLAASGQRVLLGRHKCVFVCTFSRDEPVREVINAFRILGDSFQLYVTGNSSRWRRASGGGVALPANVHLTGFLPEVEYRSLLAAADMLIVITTNEHTLTCGAYEGVSLSKPMVLGNTETIMRYFARGAVYVGPTAESIADGIARLFANIEFFKSEIGHLRIHLQRDWAERFQKLEARLIDVA
jgi:hypothetical protein